MAKEVNKDLKAAFKAITDKRGDYETLFSYYDGSATLKYSTERLARAFDKSFVYFAENWAGVIINAVLDRLVLKGFDAGNDSVNNKIDELFTNLKINLDARDIHEALQVVGEAFLIVDMVEGETEVYFNHPSNCEMFYNPDRPKIKSYAAKMWVGSDGMTHMNLYYPDRTEKYISPSGQTAGSFQLESTETNETGVIPVFHFKNSRRIIKGELDPSTVSMLDAINKLFSDLMVAAEFEAFKLRVFVSQANPGDLNAGGDRFFWSPARETEGEDTKVIEIGGSELERFLKPINQIAESLAIQTRTPKHFFISLGANISGEALVVEESGLVKKVMSKQESYTPEWQAAMAYLLSLNGITVDENELVPIWETPESKLPLTEAQTILTETQAGIPLISALRRRGLGEDELEQVKAEREEDSARKETQLANAMQRFNRE